MDPFSHQWILVVTSPFFHGIPSWYQGDWNDFDAARHLVGTIIMSSRAELRRDADRLGMGAWVPQSSYFGGLHTQTRPLFFGWPVDAGNLQFCLPHQQGHLCAMVHLMLDENSQNSAVFPFTHKIIDLIEHAIPSLEF